MATTIKLKSGSGAPTSGQLVAAEPAFDLTNKRLYTEDSGGTVIEIGTSPSTIDINAGTVDGISSLSTANGTDVSFAGVSATKFFWDASAESLGIGTSSPSYILDLYDSSGDASVNIKSNSTYSNLLFSRNGSGGDVRVRSDVANNTLEVITGGSERMRIDSSGNVGIGTSSPAKPLHIAGDVQIGESSGGEKLFFRGGSTKYNFMVGKQVNVDNGFEITPSTAADGMTFSTPAVVIKETGNVGIGTSSPSKQLEVQNGTAGTSIRVSNNGGGYADLSVSSNATSTATLAFTNSLALTGGNVGIGTSSPSENLHVTDSSGSAAIQISAFGTGNNDATLILDGNGTGLCKIEADKALTFSVDGGSTEAARIDSSGNLLAGKTTTDFGVAGTIIESGGNVGITRTSAAGLNINRLTTDGDIAKFYKNGTTVGSIGSIAGVASYLVLDPRAGGVGFGASTGVIAPTNNAGAFTDNLANLGNASYRFKDLYLSGGVSNPAAGGTLTFGTVGTERMRIDSSGNLLVNKTSYLNAGHGVIIGGNATNGVGFKWTRTAGTGTEYAASFFDNAGTGIGNISHTTTSTSYNTSSDYRLKENVVAMDDASSRVLALKPCRFNFIADPDKTVDGFLAHETQEVVPEAVTGSKDAMRTEEYEVSPAVEATYDEEGNELTPYVPAVMGTREVPDYQGIDQSKLVPLLTKALQEALTEIESLKARLDVGGL